MTLFDATVPLAEGVPIFPGDPAFSMETVCSLGGGGQYNLAAIGMGTHTGTHIDSPYHLFPDGAGVDEITPGILLGAGAVLDVRGHSVIGRKELESVNAGSFKRILLKTDSGNLLRSRIFSADYPYLTPDAALYLQESGTLLVGVDYLSVDAFDSDLPVHRILLKAGIVILESADLFDVPPGPCRIYCLPLKITGGDGAPARLIVETE
jgi:arylformamidase